MFEDDPIQIQMENLKKSNVAHECVADQNSLYNWQKNYTLRPNNYRI